MSPPRPGCLLLRLVLELLSVASSSKRLLLRPFGCVEDLLHHLLYLLGRQLACKEGVVTIETTINCQVSQFGEEEQPNEITNLSSIEGVVALRDLGLASKWLWRAAPS